MFSVQFNNPNITRWQTRLARIPRWGWIAFFIGAVIPAIVLLIVLFITFFFTGLTVMAVALLVGWVISRVRRLGRQNTRLPSNQIVVRSVRVIDP
jgi:hypothetical protein